MSIGCKKDKVVVRVREVVGEKGDIWKTMGTFTLLHLYLSEKKNSEFLEIILILIHRRHRRRRLFFCLRKKSLFTQKTELH